MHYFYKASFIEIEYEIEQISLDHLIPTQKEFRAT